MLQLAESRNAAKRNSSPTPMPIEYITAVAAIQQCIDIDDALYWDKKADALTAWAKIYHSNEVERKAKKLKLHAYRRIGELSNEIVKLKNSGGSGGGRKVLISAGMSSGQADAARKLAKASPEKFAKLLDRKVVLGPLASANSLGDRCNTDLTRKISTVKSLILETSPEDCAMYFAGNAKFIELIDQACEWFDEVGELLERSPRIKIRK